MRSVFFIVLILASVPLVMRRPLWGVAIYLGFNIIRPEMLFWEVLQEVMFFFFIIA